MWSLNKGCSDKSGKTMTSPLSSETRRSGATRRPAAYSHGVARRSKAVAPTHRLSLASSTVFFSRERVFVASARTYLFQSQRGRPEAEAWGAVLVFAIDQGDESSAGTEAKGGQLSKGCQGAIRLRGRSGGGLTGLEEVLQRLVVSGNRIGVSDKAMMGLMTTYLYVSRSLWTSSSWAGWRRRLGLPHAVAIAEPGVSQSHKSPAYKARGVCWLLLFKTRQRQRRRRQQQLQWQRKEQEVEPQSAGQPPCLASKVDAKKPRLDHTKLLAFCH